MKRTLCAHLPTLALKPLLTWVLLGLTLAFLTACQCDTSEKAQSAKAPRPLEEVGVPSDIEAEIYPDVGTTTPRPAVLVLSRSSEVCGAAQDLYRGRAHVLCRLGEGQEAQYAEDEAALMRALAFFKKKYSIYFDGRPAHLVTDAAFGPLGWTMLLKNPAVFGYAYLPGLRDSLLSQTTMYALHSKGAEQLVVDLPRTKRLQLLAQVARRGGLELSYVGRGPEGLREALQHLVQADERLVPKALKP